MVIPGIGHYRLRAEDSSRLQLAAAGSYLGLCEPLGDCFTHAGERDVDVGGIRSGGGGGGGGGGGLGDTARGRHCKHTKHIVDKGKPKTSDYQSTVVVDKSV